MEHLRDSRPVTTVPFSVPFRVSATRDRALATISGNVQTFTVERKPGAEHLDLAHSAENVPPLSRPLHIYAPPEFTLGSNDQRAENLRRLESRRQQKEARLKRRPDPDRPYLRDPRYLEYRIRERCEPGKDGQTVWSDAVEESFQNAIVAIRPMGKKKATQLGKPFGRNELIAEWILRETGEVRDRKQISSHIQVLNNKFKGCAAWKALTKAQDNKSDTDRRMYYSNSIEQRVKKQRASREDTESFNARLERLPLSDLAFGTPGDPHEKHAITHLDFHMWVSVPNAMDQALHSYSRVQTPIQITGPVPLESVPHWRMSFPALRPNIDGSTPVNDCDLVLLETSFRLMADFPPRHSKLGISLELDFLPPTDSKNYLDQSTHCICETYIYRNGIPSPDKNPVLDQCHVAGSYKVKPFFESKWWATTFTELTEKKRHAESSRDAARIEVANEYCRNYFKSITVMQVIRACPSVDGQPVLPMWSQWKRLGILLWKFSQAQGDWEGTTTWRKLIPPPDRTTTNSPLPPDAEMALPPLSMDTTIHDAHGNDLFDPTEHFYTGDGQADFPLYDPSMDAELCQDGFLSHDSGGLVPASLPAAFSMEASTRVPVADFHNYSEFHFDMASHELPAPVQARINNSTDAFDAKRDASQNLTQPHGASYGDLAHQFEEQMPRRPLSSFDVTTHQVLQAQLTDDDSLPRAPLSSPGARPAHGHARGFSALSFDEDALRAALTGASAMLSNQEDEQFHDPQSQTLSQPSFSTSPLFGRPALQSHHSFAGFSTADHHHINLLDLHGDINSQAFANNQAQSALAGANLLSGQEIDELTDAVNNHRQAVSLAQQMQSVVDPALPAGAHASIWRTERDILANLKAEEDSPAL